MVSAGSKTPSTYFSWEAEKYCRPHAPLAVGAQRRVAASPHYVCCAVAILGGFPWRPVSCPCQKGTRLVAIEPLALFTSMPEWQTPRPRLREASVPFDRIYFDANALQSGGWPRPTALLK